MREERRYKISADYCIILCLCAALVALALVFDTPDQILRGYWRINTSRSVLVTDYIALGGMGAALINAAVSGFLFLFLLIYNRREADGAIIAALWTTIGFSLFGKNIFNMLPILVGVWLYSRFTKTKFSTLFVQAMLSSTIAPLVSEIAFLNEAFSLQNMLVAYGVGMFVGFIFPVVSAAVMRMNHGYCLYNSGIAGGFIATFCVGLLRSLGIEILPERIWDTSHTLMLSAVAYAIALLLIGYGLFRDKPAAAFKKLWLMFKEAKEDNDYLVKYGGACYINMGAMCIMATTAMLFLRIPINGPVLGGIFTVTGFSAYGKNLKNTAPILLGSIMATGLNYLEQTAPSNSLAMLFSTGLAPIAGKFGWHWGMVVGFLHVSIAIFIGQLNGGLNLYNNGFAESFITITIVPLIIFLKESFKKEETEEKIEE